MRIRRVYAEKKPGYRAHETVEGAREVRVLHRYDVEGDLSDADWARCVAQVFSEPAADLVYETLPDDGGFHFSVAYLPGQYDQRADSAMQCIAAITGKPAPLVETARVFLCAGTYAKAEQAAIKARVINPVDSHEVGDALPKTLRLKSPEPPPVTRLDGFIRKTDAQLRALHAEMGLAMRPEDLSFIRDYFVRERRDPTVTEIRVIDTYWSDHCRHTTFTTELTDITFADGPNRALFEGAYRQYRTDRRAVYGDKADERPVTLMDIAVMGMKVLKRQGYLNDLDESDEINACSIAVPVDVGGRVEEWLLQFKNETHNHPTEIEPFGGAATCLGGAIRDPLSGRAYVYQAMRVTGCGDPTDDGTWPGKLPQKTLTRLAAAGFSSYGNQIGLATGQVTEIYHPGYQAKRMEIGAVIGAVKRANVRRETPEPGDIVLLLGGRTGRDGIGGATGSSRGHSEESLTACGAEVQKGNPITERKLQRLFRNPAFTALVKRCNDFGAGGVCVAVGELADGLAVDLDAVPKKYDGLDGTELAISESQERMAVVTAAADAPAVMELAREENLEATPIAAVKADGRVTMTWRGDVIVDIERAFLSSNGAPRSAQVTVDAWETGAGPDERDIPAALRGANSGGIDRALNKSSADPARWLDNLRQLNVACQKGLAERFDASIGAATVLAPFCGKHRLTPAQAMAAKLPVDGETHAASLMAFGFDPDRSFASPFHGAAGAVVESLAKLVAAGGDYLRARLTFQEYFERLGEDPRRWQKPFLALLGAYAAQTALKTPSIGGKDSMSGSFERHDVPPTLVSFAVCAADARRVLSPELKGPGHALVSISPRYENGMPDFGSVRAVFDAVTRLIAQGAVLSAYTPGAGGLAAALTKMALGNGVGAEIVCDSLYAWEPGAFLLEMAGPNAPRVPGAVPLGRTVDEPVIRVNGAEILLSDCHDAWIAPLECVFPTGRLQKTAEAVPDVPLYDRPNTPRPAAAAKGAAAPARTARPRVFIPVFPGSNCEYDTAAAFAKAGAEPDVFVVRNLTLADLDESVAEMARRIGQAQMLALPGGFSAGDEPEGSGKFITALLRNAYIAEAVTDLLRARDGLVLGICNGFQALVKSGLLPFGELRALTPDAPTLTYNAIGRHVSDLVTVRVTSARSPWLSNTSAGETYLAPVSHGEGRFVADEETLRGLAERGQIATQYTDPDGAPSMDIRHNPNGSRWAIEGITSPDGRVLGKMGHSERIGADLYKGFGQPTDMKIFEAGVGYFS